MRKFWVRNARGQVFDMNRDDAFFSKPKGLGIARKAAYTQIGYSFMEKENVLSQKKPYGNMVFDGYEQYEEFCRILQFTPLVLMYQPLDTMYYMDVNTFTIEKGDISEKDTFLTCKVTFEGTTPWYAEKKAVRKESALDGKKYEYAYPYLYTDYASGEAELVNDSGMEAYCRLKLYGPLDTPYWRLVQNGVTVSEGKVLGKIENGSCLVVDSNPGSLEIAEYDLLERFVKDRYEDSDFDTRRFIYLPPGSSRLKISHAGTANVKFLVEVMEFAG